MTDATIPPKQGKQDRSPPFPFIGLAKALERTQQLFDKAKRFEVRLDDAGADWGFAPKSSSTFQTVGALLAYGLLEDSGTGENRKVKVSDVGWRILEDKRPGIREKLLAEAALRPKIIAEYAERWKDGRPDEAHCLSQLKFESKFTSEGAAKFLKVYDDTIRFTKDVKPDREADNSGGGRDTAASKEKVAIAPGQFVQWTSNGVEQFRLPRKVAKVEGEFAWVHGSNTGIPMTELTTVDPPKPTVLTPSIPVATTGEKLKRDIADDISVLLTGNRLQISADIDNEGLVKLRKVLDQYEQILKLLQ